MAQRDPLPEYDELPAWPEPIDPARLPAHLRDNPVMQLYLRLTPEQRAGLAKLAAEDAADDEAVARELIASVR